MIKILIDLTRELLNSGVFSHLPDNEIARLHWMILQGDNGMERTLRSGSDQWSQRSAALPLQPLLSFWYRGDYYSSNSSPRLLQQCNEYLQRMGQPLIDVYGEEFYEA